MVIEELVAESGRSLRGPRRLKKSLLDEAAAGLADTVDAYCRQGLEPSEATRRAVDAFGTVEEIRPLYQAVLDDARRRRTVAVILILLPAMAVVWNLAWALAPAERGTPPVLLPQLAGVLGGVAMVAALVAGWGGMRNPCWPAASQKAAAAGEQSPDGAEKPIAAADFLPRQEIAGRPDHRSTLPRSVGQESVWSDPGSAFAPSPAGRYARRPPKSVHNRK